MATDTPAPTAHLDIDTALDFLLSLDWTLALKTKPVSGAEHVALTIFRSAIVEGDWKAISIIIERTGGKASVRKEAASTKDDDEKWAKLSGAFGK